MNRPDAGERDLRDYVRELEARFHRLRGAPGVVSPRDFALMLEWYERRIPLAVILEAMTEAFARAEPEGIGTLAYLRRPVDRRFRHYREARLGAGSGDAASSALQVREIATFLRRSLDRVRDAGKRHGGDSRELRLVIRGLERLLDHVGPVENRGAATLPDLEKLERALARLDRHLLAAILSWLDAGERERLRRAAESSLSPYREAMSPTVLRRSVERRFHQGLRQATNLPELSLFTL
jgi:hypothetical protein